MNNRPDPLPAHLRRLSTDALAALVADVWAARGYETDRRGSTVVARGVGTRRIRVSGADSRVPVMESSTGVVIVPGGVAGVGTRAMDVDDLGELIRYGIAADQRDRICERHLGAPPGALDVPWQVRVHTHLWGRARPAISVVGVLLCALLAASVAGLPDLGITGGTGDHEEVAGVARPGTSDSTAGPAPARGQSTNDPREDHTVSKPPPGLGPGGAEDLSQLDTAHDRAIGNRSYTMRVDLYWPRAGQPRAERVHRNMEFRVAADGRYLLQTTVRAHANESTQADRPDLRVYHDGRDWYVAESTDEGLEYRRVPGSQQPPVAVPEPAAFRKRLASWYLSTPELHLVTTSRGTQPEYRLVGRGRPLGASPGITNYSVRAFVRSDGLIKHLSTRSTRRVTPPVDQRFAVTHDRFGTTAVTTPAWVVEEFDMDRSR